MISVLKTDLGLVDLLLMAVACVGAGAFARQALTFHEYQPNEPPAGYFPVAVQYAEKGKPVTKVVLWNRLEDYQSAPAFTIDLPVGSLDAALPRRERDGASVTGKVVSEGATTRVTLSDDDGNNVFKSEYLLSKGRLTPVRHEVHQQGVVFYMAGAGVAGALAMGAFLASIRRLWKRRA